MHAELLMIGTELLIGQIEDTNSTWLGQQLAEHGINLYQKTTVGDNKLRIMAAMAAALDRGAVVLCSGGLGPTEDDITREAIAELLGRPLEFREDLYEQVLERFAHLRHLITDNNKKQATLPAGAIALENPRGTAPGLIVEDARGAIVCMPGVPHELKGMMREQVLPWLCRRFDVSGTLHYRVIKVCGLGESRVDALIGDIINAHSNPAIGLLASPESVRIRVSARADSREAAEALIAPVAEAVEARLPGLVMGYDDDTIESVVARLLSQRGWKLAVGETSTGGMICQRLVASGLDAFGCGRVFPPRQTEGNPLSPGQAIDLATDLLLDSGSDCALVLLEEQGANRSIGCFLSPDGRHDFEIGHLGGGVRQQTRSSVMALEQVRRYLTRATVIR